MYGPAHPGTRERRSEIAMSTVVSERIAKVIDWATGTPSSSCQIHGRRLAADWTART